MIFDLSGSAINRRTRSFYGVIRACRCFVMPDSAIKQKNSSPGIPGRGHICPPCNCPTNQITAVYSVLPGKSPENHYKMKDKLWLSPVFSLEKPETAGKPLRFLYDFVLRHVHNAGAGGSVTHGKGLRQRHLKLFGVAPGVQREKKRGPDFRV
jgi:hypothetical protein